MDAIETRYHGATNYRGSRITARTLGNYPASATVSYDHALSTLDNHRNAAAVLLAKIGWDDVAWTPGSTATGYVFVALVAAAETVGG